MHVRHRRVHPDEHRRCARRVEVGPAHHGRVEAVAAAASCATRSRARRSSPAPRCSGCATACSSSRRRPRSRRSRRSVPDSGGVIVVPAFAGLGAPHWRPEARGTITGLTRGTTRAHIARATLEGIALQNVDILRAMERDCGPAADHAQGRRRRLGERPADAVPERRARRRDLAPRARRDHRARRRVPRRASAPACGRIRTRSARPGASRSGSRRPRIARRSRSTCAAGMPRSPRRDQPTIVAAGSSIRCLISCSAFAQYSPSSMRSSYV